MSALPPEADTLIVGIDVRMCQKQTQSLNPSNLAEMRHTRSRCDSLVTWRTLFWWVESGSEN